MDRDAFIRFLADLMHKLTITHDLAHIALDDNEAAITTVNWRSMDLVLDLAAATGIALSLPEGYSCALPPWLAEKCTDVITHMEESIMQASSSWLLEHGHLEEVWIGEEEVGRIDPCEVCEEEFELGMVVVATWCGHHFHHDCLTDWYVEDFSCPNCGKYLLMDSDDD